MQGFCLRFGNRQEMTRKRFVSSAVSLVVFAGVCGCGGSGGTAPSAPSRQQTYALTAGVDTLPNSNGYACTMQVPPNDAPSGASITVTMPPPGVSGVTYVPIAVGYSGPAYYSTAYPNPAQIVASTSAAVTFAAIPVATCALIGSTASPIGFLDPNDPGAIYGPSVSVVTGSDGAATLSVPANVSFPIGTL